MFIRIPKRNLDFLVLLSMDSKYWSRRFIHGRLMQMLNDSFEPTFEDVV